MGLFKNLDPDKAARSHERREIISGLKPIGLYQVMVVAFHSFLKGEGVPVISFELKILGLIEGDGRERKYRYARKTDGSRVYENARLFFKAYISDQALFGLENILQAMGQDGPFGKDLALKLQSFDNEAKLNRWINSWLDTDTEFTVYVNHHIPTDTDPEDWKPQERVHFQDKNLVLIDKD